MRIYRFDEGVSIRVSDFGSQFRIGPLTGGDSRTRVQMMYLGRDGRIGRHPAQAQQLFAVVSGRGWVSGHDGDRRDIGPGYAALWEPGEEHESGTDEGLTAICIEGHFEVWALTVTEDIVVSDYNDDWPRWFETVRDHVWPAIEDIAIRIDHVGSTSVAGLAAKPIIDMDIVVAREGDVRPVIQRLSAIGYRWRGDLGVPGREAFQPNPDNSLPAHHLYLVVENNKAHLDHWLLRDLLREDPAARDRYAALKKRNVEAADGDMDVYTAAKAKLVAELLTRARAERGLPPARYWDPDIE